MFLSPTKNPKFSYFRFDTHSYFPESGKHFQASGMRAIDFSYKIIPRKVIVAKISKNFFSEMLLQSLPHPFKSIKIFDTTLLNMVILFCWVDMALIGRN